MLLIYLLSPSLCVLPVQIAGKKTTKLWVPDDEVSAETMAKVRSEPCCSASLSLLRPSVPPLSLLSLLCPSVPPVSLCPMLVYIYIVVM